MWRNCLTSEQPSLSLESCLEEPNSFEAHSEPENPTAQICLSSSVREKCRSGVSWQFGSATKSQMESETAFTEAEGPG